MRIIPVLDLKGGAVVHARRGERARYRPLQARAGAARAEAVVRGLLQRRPFPLFYVADLDAIEGRADHRRCLAELAARFPAQRFWVDRGGELPAELEHRPNVQAVLGSESGYGPEQLAARTVPPAALSLDFHDGSFLGNPALLEHPDCWPDTVILLDLARAGSGLGPDLARLRWLRHRAGGRTLLAGGGVRDARDLQRLQAAGASGALVATALHENRLD